MKLEDLGPRICILGPSTSGKSTLAEAIGRSLAIPAIHIDQLHHLPNTDWQLRPDTEFLHLHEEAISQPAWVMAGNYTRCLPQRLERATGVIRLGLPTYIGLFRYFRRCWFETNRLGALEGGVDRVKWEMIRYIVFTTPAKQARNDEMFEDIELPKIELSTPKELAAFYKDAGLTR